MGSSSLIRDWTPGPMHWELGVSATGPPREVPCIHILKKDIDVQPDACSRSSGSISNPRTQPAGPGRRDREQQVAVGMVRMPHPATPARSSRSDRVLLQALEATQGRQDERYPGAPLRYAELKQAGARGECPGTIKQHHLPLRKVKQWSDFFFTVKMMFPLIVEWAHVHLCFPKYL